MQPSLFCPVRFVCTNGREVMLPDLHDMEDNRKFITKSSRRQLKMLVVYGHLQKN